MENIFDDLEKTFSAKLFGTTFGDLENLIRQNCSTIWRNCLALALEIWRNLFGEIVRHFGENTFGDLEKTCSAIWRKHARRVHIGVRREVAYSSATTSGR